MRVSVLAFCVSTALSTTGLMLRSAASAQTVSGNAAFYYQDYQSIPLLLTPEPTSPSPSDTALPIAPSAQTVSSETRELDFPRPDASPSPPLDFPTPLIVPTQPSATPAPSPANSPASTSIPLGELAVVVSEVQVNGGTPELQQLVRETVQTKAGGATNDSQLQSDVTALLNTGLFTSAYVQTERSPQGIIVIYVIDPVIVRLVQVSGSKVLPEAIADQAFATQIGQPISPMALRQSADLINQWYLDNGYKLAQVTQLIPQPDGLVTVNVLEVVVRQVNIQFVNAEGNTVDEEGEPIQGRTRETFLQQEIQIQPGEVFNENTARADLQRLQDLQLFDDARVALQVEGAVADVTYTLQERLSRAFNLGGGYNTDVGLFGTVAYSDRNFGGIGQQLTSDIQISGRGLQFGGRFTHPYRASQPNQLGYSIYGFRRRSLSATFTDEVELANGSRIREGRFGGGASIMRSLGDWDAELGLNYSRISLRDSEGEIFAEDELGNPLTLSGTGIDELFTLSFQATQDRRDNPLNPSRGSVLSLGTEQSIPIGNGNILMNRLQASYAYYVPVDLIGNSFANHPETLAFNVQLGTILGDVPPYEAFNLGGTNSVRGYGLSEVGTGQSYALTSMEYRFPIFSPVGGVLFADFATDLGTADDVFGEPANVRDKPGSGFGVGLGVRVNSPFGLLRLDFGINDQGGNQIHFGFGQRF
jgi:outer membrane protein insertion porin family